MGEGYILGSGGETWEKYTTWDIGVEGRVMIQGILNISVRIFEYIDLPLDRAMNSLGPLKSVN
jgi:hypothetical protein